MDLCRRLRSSLSPSAPQFQPDTLHELCIRTAAIHATVSLYEFHVKHKRRGQAAAAAAAAAAQAEGGLLQQMVGGGGAASSSSSSSSQDAAAWEAVFPMLDQHFFQLVPDHLYEQFLNYVLSALETAGHFDAHGQQLTQYILLFFPRRIRRFRAQRYADSVLMPTICCLHRCTAFTELYLERADSPAVTTYLLAHLLKHMTGLKVLALPKQCDDDVASVVGLNCRKLESIVLTGTNVTNVGLSWLLCCKQLHTVIMPGFFQGITPKGVALLLNGLPTLRHVVYDVMSDVLTYVDFNTFQTVLPEFGLKTILFHSMELLSSNSLELVTKLCPHVEWLSLDSALFYNLEGLGSLPKLRLLRLNYKSRQLDQTVVDFMSLNAHNLTTLQLFEVRDLHLEHFHLTVGQCVNLETLVLHDCTFQAEWYALRFPLTELRSKPLSKSVTRLQLFKVRCASAASASEEEEEANLIVSFVALFQHLTVLEMDVCELRPAHVKLILLAQPMLETWRCREWTRADANSLQKLQQAFKHCRLLGSRGGGAYGVWGGAGSEEEDDRSTTMAAGLLAEYAKFSNVLSVNSVYT